MTPDHVSPYVGRLTVNSELLTLPCDLGEFVIVHELVHLLTPNHGRIFTDFLHAYLPEWREREWRPQGHSETHHHLTSDVLSSAPLDAARP